MLKIIKYGTQRKWKETSRNEGQSLQLANLTQPDGAPFTATAPKGGRDPCNTILSNYLTFSLRM